MIESSELVDYVEEGKKVFVMLSHGGCVVRGKDAAHVFALAHGYDAAAQIQVRAAARGSHVARRRASALLPPCARRALLTSSALGCLLWQVYAELTGMPLLELPEVQVKAFPRHGYGDMSIKSKRMELYFAANKRLLLSNWNQGFRDTGDRTFAL